eukprot:542111-Rhodomonas_salina.1
MLVMVACWTSCSCCTAMSNSIHFLHPPPGTRQPHSLQANGQSGEERGGREERGRGAERKEG